MQERLPEKWTKKVRATEFAQAHGLCMHVRNDCSLLQLISTISQPKQKLCEKSVHVTNCNGFIRTFNFSKSQTACRPLGQVQGKKPESFSDLIFLSVATWETH